MEGILRLVSCVDGYRAASPMHVALASGDPPTDRPGGVCGGSNMHERVFAMTAL